MSWTSYAADLLSGRFDARLRESELEPYIREIDAVSNNLGAYFLFCLFGSAILALFFSGVLCELCKQACLSLFYVAKLGRFLCINKFLQAGYSGFQVTGMIEWYPANRVSFDLPR